METKEYLCELTKQFWHFYLLTPNEESFETLFSYIADKLVLIGTGRHEVFNSAEKAILNLRQNLVEARNVEFELLDEWYDGISIGSDAYMVYGGVWARQKENENLPALIEMDTRFSVVYERDEAGSYKMVHIHHSMPYFDQHSEEYYPKTLLNKVQEAMELVEVFRKKAEMDLMTSLYNHESFRKMVENELQSGTDLELYILDLDHFKIVNDTYGHDVGDMVLRTLSQALKKHFSGDSFIGRIGGDEFAVCLLNPQGREQSEGRLAEVKQEYMENLRSALAENVNGYSIGVAKCCNGDLPYMELYKRADEALYSAKKHGRDHVVWYDDTAKVAI